MTRRVIGAALAIVLFAAMVGCAQRMPDPDSDAYAEAVAAFYTGIAAMEVGEDRRAEEQLLRVVDLAPDEPAAWANLGLLALRRNELDLAAERLNQARELAPEASRIHFLLGLLGATRGDAEGAIAHFERARSLDPRNVRALYALAEQMETYRGEGASEDVRRLIDAILEIQPNNLAVLVERARLAAIAGDERALRETIERLQPFAARWSEEAQDQFADVRAATRAESLNEATTALTFLSNVLKRESAYRESLAAVRTQPGQPSELIGHLMALPLPPHEPSPPDDSLTFETEPLFAGEVDGSWQWARAVALSAEGPPALVAGNEERILFEDGTRLGTPGTVSHAGLITIDFDYDFRVDVALAGDGGFRILQQADDSTFADVTDRVGLPATVKNGTYAAGWAADVDMEGDLDLILARVDGPPVVLRNNGDETFSVLDRFGDVTRARDMVWTDLDSDGDPDAVFVDASGSAHFYENNRSQGFAHQLIEVSARDVVAADTDKDGTFEIILLTDNGEIVRRRSTAETDSAAPDTLARWDGASLDGARLFTADVDNNGAVDFVVSAGGRSAVFLNRDDSLFARLDAAAEADVFTLADVTGAGRLDLIGITDARPVRLENRGTKNYQSTSIRPLAAEATGDQRINPFGLGGEVEIRSGLLFQKQPISDPIVHFGLGDRQLVEVARIVWPNGDIQAEFDLLSDEMVQARQRLKGSCPWLFAFDGNGMRFVTDFIWRSPLGLRINAQETAGVMMTEDWVKVEGGELKPRAGAYDLRITAELWETHFFDHVSLMVVDHPVGTEIFVDERFAFPPPDLKVYVTGTPTPAARVTDEAGRDVTELAASEDDRYVATFEKGQYQGVARPHAIQIDLRDAPSDGPLYLLASGWIRPTDSSINVAVAQGAHRPPTGLQLDVPDGTGGWKTVYPNLGFPAGKYKTIVIDLTDVFPADQVVRLATNLEIYWDAIRWARGMPGTEIRSTRVHPSDADLSYRGYSVVEEPDRTHPEVPIYDSLAASVQVWQDLAGYYTRFGDVRELLRFVDDRYVIMNAGDELRFKFPAPDEPADGWTRDFIVIGDGWVKDGDYNTLYSETVRPLPAHDLPEYEGPRLPLEEDPVYLRNPEDWRIFHTRYVRSDVL